MANPKPWFPFYASDWLVDTTGWPAEARGIHIQFMAYWWANQMLPLCFDKLTAIAGCSLEQFESNWTTYLQYKWHKDGDGYVNNRLKAEYKTAVKIQKTRRESGRLGGQASGRAKAKQTGKQKVTQSQSQESQSQLPQKIIKKGPQNYDQDFLTFWNIYPRKVAKPSAQKAWTAKQCEQWLGHILSDIERRLKGEWDGADPQFIPHPTTYLNQRRWEDEPDQDAGHDPYARQARATARKIRDRQQGEGAGVHGSDEGDLPPLEH